MNATAKPHVFHSLLFGVLIWSTLLKKSYNFNLLNIISFSFLTIISLIFLKKVYDSKEVIAQRKNKFNNLYRIKEEFLKKNKSILHFSTHYLITWNNPYSISKMHQTNKELISGWMANSPLNKKIKSHYQLVENNGIFIRKSSIQKVGDLIVKNVSENYNINVRYKIEKSYDDFAIISFYHDNANK